MGFLTKMKPRERFLVSVTGGMLVLLIVYHGIWVPLTKRFETLQDEIFAMQMKLRKAHLYAKQRDQVLQEAKKFPNLEQLDAKKDEEETASLLNFIEKEARDVQVTLFDVKPQHVSSDKASKRYRVDLTTESGLKEFTEFIYHLQYSPQMLRIEHVQMTPKEDKSPVLRSSLSVTRVVVK